MITLETEFKSGVGGFSGPDVLTYKQIIRSDIAAVYERSRNGLVKDYETITIKTNPKGFQIFNGTPLTDDTETYPSTGQFGFKAWSFGNKVSAINKFNELNTSDSVNPDETIEAGEVVESGEPIVSKRGRQPKVRVELLIPIGKFTTKELAELNKTEYQDAVFFINESVNSNTIKFIGEERRNVKGKPSKIFEKV